LSIYYEHTAAMTVSALWLYLYLIVDKLPGSTRISERARNRIISSLILTAQRSATRPTDVSDKTLQYQ
jgi:hypothetical protein